MADGDYVYAQFSRPAYLEFTNPDTGSTEVNDLDNESFYLIMAAGQTMLGLPTEHDEEGASSEMIAFCGSDCEVDDATSFDYSSCGEDKTCYGFPEGCLDTEVRTYLL